jgi:hypothetical protein
MWRIVESLRAQTVPVEIWVINNAGCEDFGADRGIFIPWNIGECARYMFARRVETEWVMFQDDDHLILDDDFLASAMELHEKHCPRAILGVNGRGLQLNSPYYWPEVVHGYAAIAKGHFQLFKRSALGNVHIPEHPSASDIYWSLDIGRGKQAHWIDQRLRARMEHLDTHDVGYEFREEHWTERDAVCRAYIEEYGVDS